MPTTQNSVRRTFTTGRSVSRSSHPNWISAPARTIWATSLTCGRSGRDVVQQADRAHREGHQEERRQPGRRAGEDDRRQRGHDDRHAAEQRDRLAVPPVRARRGDEPDPAGDPLAGERGRDRDEERDEEERGDRAHRDARRVTPGRAAWPTCPPPRRRSARPRARPRGPAPGPRTSGRRPGRPAAAATAARSTPTRRLVPSSTVTARSVFRRSVRHGTPSTVVSSWTPPESVSTRRRVVHQRRGTPGSRAGPPGAAAAAAPARPSTRAPRADAGCGGGRGSSTGIAAATGSIARPGRRGSVSRDDPRSRAGGGSAPRSRRAARPR